MPSRSSTAEPTIEALLPMKVVKSILLLVLVCVTIWQGYLNVQKYLKHDAVTTVSKVSADSIDFPQVTICNYNRWKLSLLTPDAIEQAFSAYYKANGIYTNKGSRSNTAHFTPIDLYNFTYKRGWHLVDKFNAAQFAGNASSTLLKCYFAGTQCNSMFFRHRMTSYGNCYTFNKEVTKDDLDSIGGDSSLLKLPLQQTHASEANGLELYINIQADDNSESNVTNGSPLLGLKVLVHSKNDQPDPTVSGISVGPGFYATIGIRRTEYDNIEPPEGECVPNQQLKYFDTYTHSSCETECRMLLTEKNCSCIPYFYPNASNLCNIDDTLGCAAKIEGIINKNFSQYCKCPEPCNYEEFISTVSYAPFPNSNIGRELESSKKVPLNFIRQNWVGLKIYFAEIGSTVVSQAPAHTVTSTLNDLGGTSGLYIGFSFMTFIELAQLITELAYGLYLKKKNEVRSIFPSTSSIKK